MRTLRSLVFGGLAGLVVAAQMAAGVLIVTGCSDLESASPSATSVAGGGSASTGGATSTGGAGVTAVGGATGTTGAGGMTGGATAGGGANTGGAGAGGASGGTGGALVEMVPDFSLVDMNAASPTAGQAVSPRDYQAKVSAWYFGHST
ncbi:MAG: hypothetical protein U0441_02670 [Polyangiaceae bacterium]